jgi:predicted alpha/beta superfamily hydrolase
MSHEDIAEYIGQHSDCDGGAFLDFLTNELHPQLQSRFRVSDTGHGLFGFSYGGLFALYAWLRGGTPFATVGAGTPGISSADSQLFDMIGDLPERGDDDSAIPRLHVTLNRIELLGDVPVYRSLARNVLRALEELRHKGRSDAVSISMLDETHVTGVQASFLSYLKECHVR